MSPERTDYRSADDARSIGIATGDEVILRRNDARLPQRDGAPVAVRNGMTGRVVTADRRTFATDQTPDATHDGVQRDDDQVITNAQHEHRPAAPAVDLDELPDVIDARRAAIRAAVAEHHRTTRPSPQRAQPTWLHHDDREYNDDQDGAERDDHERDHERTAGISL
jgi:hypothetical protein